MIKTIFPAIALAFIYLFISEVSYVAGGSMKGSFTGTAKTASGEAVDITDGVFNVKFIN